MSGRRKVRYESYTVCFKRFRINFKLNFKAIKFHSKCERIHIHKKNFWCKSLFRKCKYIFFYLLVIFIFKEIGIYDKIYFSNNRFLNFMILNVIFEGHNCFFCPLFLNRSLCFLLILDYSNEISQVLLYGNNGDEKSYQLSNLDIGLISFHIKLLLF